MANTPTTPVSNPEIGVNYPGLSYTPTPTPANNNNNGMGTPGPSYNPATGTGYNPANSGGGTPTQAPTPGPNPAYQPPAGNGLYGTNWQAYKDASGNNFLYDPTSGNLANVLSNATLQQLLPTFGQNPSLEQNAFANAPLLSTNKNITQGQINAATNPNTRLNVIGPQSQNYSSGGQIATPNNSGPTNYGQQLSNGMIQYGVDANGQPIYTPPNQPFGQQAGTTAVPTNMPTQPVNTGVTSNSITSSANAGFKAATSSGASVPQTQGEAASAVSNYTPTNNDSQLQAQLNNDPGYQQLMQDYQAYNSLANQTASLQQQYNQLMQTTGLNGINTQLINLQNVINGTEGDIRNEVAASSGFATNSQVMALSAARNKVLTQQYNNLVNVQKSLTGQITTQMNFAEKDQANALQIAKDRLNYDQQIASYIDKFKQNAIDGYNNVIKAVGYAGLYAAVANDPKSLSMVETTLGLQPGTLATAAQIDQQNKNIAMQTNQADLQLKQAQIGEAQANIEKTKSDIAKNYADIANLQAGLTGSGPGLVDATGAPISADNQSILAQTGLTLPAFYALTGQSSNLPRDAATRRAAFAEAQNWANQHGVDISTLASQYKAQNDVLQQNIARAANTKVFAGEVAGSADALAKVINDKELQPGFWTKLFGGANHTVKAQNLVDVAAGKQVNDPFAMKYATQLAAMTNDYAGYLAASRGSSQPELTDLQDAANVISSGLNTGSVNAFKQAVQANEEKVTGVVNKAVADASKSVWDLFGVGDKYKAPNLNTTSNTSQPQTYTVGGKTYTLGSDGLYYAQ